MPPKVLTHTTSLSERLERFSNLFSKGNCLQEGDSLRCVYANERLASTAACEANMLIDRLRIELVAIYSYGVSIVIKSSEVFDV
jgi:hypothetical protein